MAGAGFGPRDGCIGVLGRSVSICAQQQFHDSDAENARNERALNSRECASLSLLLFMQCLTSWGGDKLNRVAPVDGSSWSLRKRPFELRQLYLRAERNEDTDIT